MSRIAFLASCFVVAATPAFAQSKAVFQKLLDEWAAAFNRGDLKAVAAIYTADAYVLPPGAPMVHGHKAIEALWHKIMQQLSDVKCTTINVKPLGPRAAREIGTCTAKTKGQTPQDVAVKYAVVWEKSGRSWKLLQDIWNMNK
jgi:uncharacterized protein (TIGR02246 family)